MKEKKGKDILSVTTMAYRCH